MRAETLTDALIERGALLDGHFRLSSGRHSARFVQKFRILEDPEILEKIAASLAKALVETQPTVVIAAAVGGLLVGYEVARQFGTKAIFVEKEDGVPTLRRGFALGADDRALVVEDVVTTGGSVRDVLEVVRACGALAVGVGIIVRREASDFGVPTVALLDLPVESYDPARCPQCARGEAIAEPGSRYLSASAKNVSRG